MGTERPEVRPEIFDRGSGQKAVFLRLRTRLAHFCLSSGERTASTLGPAVWCKGFSCRTEVLQSATNKPQQKTRPTRQSPAKKKKKSSARELSVPAGSERLFVLGYDGQG